MNQNPKPSTALETFTQMMQGRARKIESGQTIATNPAPMRVFRPGLGPKIRVTELPLSPSTQDQATVDEVTASISGIARQARTARLSVPFAGLRGAVVFLSESPSRPRPVHLDLAAYPEFDSGSDVEIVADRGAGWLSPTPTGEATS